MVLVTASHRRRGLATRLVDACLETARKSGLTSWLDANPPLKPSGIRIGTPAVTTRGFQEKDCEQVAHWLCDIFEDLQNTSLQASIKEKVLTLCRQYPVYG